MTLAGCAIGPHYSPPSAVVPPTYKEVPQAFKPAAPADQLARGKWWELYGDAQLNSLEEKVRVSNQTLKAAVAQFEQARALVRYQRADFYPTITAGASGSRNHVSRNRGVSSSFSPTNYSDIQMPVVG